MFDFDSALKAMLYPILMDLEMAMKNLALVEILNAAGSSRLTDVYSRVMLGDKRDGRRGKLEVVHAGNGVLLDAYKRSNVIVRHYYDAPGESVPLWALMEVITLGHFGRFLDVFDEYMAIKAADPSFEPGPSETREGFGVTPSSSRRSRSNG